MRFLFAIQGEGRGHLTQALSLAEMLRHHGHEVVGVLVGRSTLRTLPAFFYTKIGAPVTEFETPQFAFDRNNRSVSMFRTLLCNVVPKRLLAFDRSMHLIRDRIEALCPDRIINFYELLTGFTVRRFGIRIPMTGIAHQFLLNHLLYRHSRRKGIQGILLRLHAHMTAWGCNDLLALSFQPMPDDFQRHIYVVPPLLRHEALEGKASDEGFILGYMVNNGFADELRHWCAQHPQYRFHVFWDCQGRPDLWQAESNLTFHRLDDRLFLQLMRRCRGYITTAGFESVCEAMYHRKPMMLIPAHIEQRINAADAAAAGAGIVSERFDPGRFTDYLSHGGGSATAQEFRTWVESAETHFLELLTRS